MSCSMVFRFRESSMRKAAMLCFSSVAYHKTATLALYSLLYHIHNTATTNTNLLHHPIPTPINHNPEILDSPIPLGVLEPYMSQPRHRRQRPENTHRPPEHPNSIMPFFAFEHAERLRKREHAHDVECEPIRIRAEVDCHAGIRGFADVAFEFAGVGCHAVFVMFELYAAILDLVIRDWKGGLKYLYRTGLASRAGASDHAAFCRGVL